MKKFNKKAVDALAVALIPGNTDLFGDQVPHVIKGALFSEDKLHRYSLHRIWDESKPMVMFIGLNPSTANAKTDDPTIKSVCRIARHNGYGGVYMLNCWTYISTEPKNVLITDRVANSQNNTNLRVFSSMSKDVVFAWGNFDIVRESGRDKELLEMFPEAKVIGYNQNGSPRHPLFCKASIILTPYNGYKKMR